MKIQKVSVTISAILFICGCSSWPQPPTLSVGLADNMVIDGLHNEKCWSHTPQYSLTTARSRMNELHPDLVMIGGISNAPEKTDAGDPEKNMITVIRRCQELGCEVLVMSPPRSWDWRTSPDPKSAWNEDLRFENEGEKLLRRDYQRAAVAATGVAYWDLTTWPCNIVAESGKPLGWFNRDAIHNNDHGKQLIGHTLAAWFRSAKKRP